MTFPILASLLVRLVVLLPFQLLRLSLATPSRWTRSEERFSRNAETDLVCRLLLEKKKRKPRNRLISAVAGNHVNLQGMNIDTPSPMVYTNLHCARAVSHAIYRASAA